MDPLNEILCVKVDVSMFSYKSKFFGVIKAKFKYKFHWERFSVHV